MTEERFRKYLAFAGLDRIGGANTRELATDLAKTWRGAVYVRIDIVDAENTALRDQLAHLQSKTHYLVCGARIEALESQLAQVTQERDELKGKVVT